MRAKKTIGYGLAILAVLAGILVFGRLWRVMDSSHSEVADDTVKLADFHSLDATAIKRGEYVMRLSDCGACHNQSFAGGYKIDTPFGKLYTSNITPDRATGIGNMTERDFFNAVRQGRGDKGLLYPAMPYTAYNKLTDQDMHDLWAYMSTIKPVNQKIDENGGMNFPYNIRLAMAGWNLLFFNNGGPANGNLSQAQDNDAGAANRVERGKYLVDGPAHCSVCHTGRNILGGEINSQYLQGGNLGDWFAPDITTNNQSGIGGWSNQEIAQYLKTGSDGKSVAAGPMAEAVEHSFQYFSDKDLQAVAAYLKTLPASATAAPQAFAMDEAHKKNAALTFEVNCSACHGVRGEGIPGMVPAFAGNKSMLNDPTNMITAMLNGARAPSTGDRPTGAGMPAFDWKMDDRQIADILNYVRNAWGNQASEVTVQKVAAIRKQTGAKQKLATPAIK